MTTRREFVTDVSFRLDLHASGNRSGGGAERESMARRRVCHQLATDRWVTDRSHRSRAFHALSAATHTQQDLD